MQKFLALLILFLTLPLCSQQPKPQFGLSFAYGNTVARPNPEFSPAYEAPLNKEWLYTSTEVFKIWNIKNIALHTGVGYQTGRQFYAVRLPVSTYGYWYVANRKLLPFLALNYAFYLNNSSNLEIGVFSLFNVKSIRTLGVKIEYNHSFSEKVPVLLGIHSRILRIHYSDYLNNDDKYPYLDNLSVGLSLKYRIKR